MCGFVGIFDKNGVTEAHRKDAVNMSAAIRHRGPDESRTAELGNALFAFRRLSIIDLTGGSQPFISGDRRFVCVFNGEIYNYLELRDELIKQGEPFESKS
ncbi:MAG: hypothetical protein IJS94_02870 [Clostridia bacterium]|nr:hypothetical protein [Clostridia bacterium]